MRRLLSRFFSRRGLLRLAFGLGFVALALVAAQIATTHYVPRTAWYRAGKQFLVTNPEVSAKIGRITDLSFIGGGSSHYYSPKKKDDAQLRIRITGSKANARAHLILVKETKGWTVRDATLTLDDGKKVKLR